MRAHREGEKPPCSKEGTVETMNEALNFVLGAAVVAVLLALRHYMTHSAPTSHSVERKRQRAIEAMALYESEAAALAAYDARVERGRLDPQRIAAPAYPAYD